MNYLILGASAAGLNAATTIRKHDSIGNITILSQDINIYSRCLLPAVIEGVRDADSARFVEEDFMKKNNVLWLGGVEAAGVSPEEKVVVLKNGERFNYDRLLIATGASSFLPPVENMDRGRQIYGVRHMEDARAIVEASADCRQAVVMGGGLVGVEVALALRKRGLLVTIVELAGHILPLQLDSKAATRYEELFREQGIVIITGEMVDRVVLDKEQNVTAVQLKTGRTINCCMLVVAAGARPNVSIVAGTYIKVARGIIVNGYQETSVKDIYAAGDVCESPDYYTGNTVMTPIWPLAVLQGQVAGSNMAGVRMKLANNFAQKNSMHFYDLPAISFGMTEALGPEYQTYTEDCGESYRKIILKDGRICGAIFQGEISKAGVFGHLIKEGITVPRDCKNVFDLSFADYFRQQDNGEFVYLANSL